MKYSVDKTSDKPVYMQIYQLLRDDIVSGALPGGMKLPSKRMLADELGVSVISTEHAYAMLTDEGYVTAKKRSGYYVTESGTAILGSRPEVTHAHSFGGTEMHRDFPFASFAKTMRRVLADYGERILERSPNNGCAELREAIAAYLSRFRGITVDPGQIVVGSGAEYLYSVLIQLLGRDLTYGIEDPSYEKIGLVYAANGVKTELLPLTVDGIASSSLERSVADVLHVTPYHSFPSGVSASPAKRKEYVEWAKKRGGYVIEDDFDSEFSVFAKPADTIFSIEPTDRVIYINTFSKSLAPSVRVGYMLLPPPLLKRYESRLGFYSCSVPVYEQLVLAEFLSSGEFERHINRMRRKERALRSEQD